MKKIYFVLILLFSVCLHSQAQSMTDDQVVEYVKKQSAAGVGQQQIGMELLSRGVTQQQLMRIREKYMRQADGTTPESGNSAEDRSRKSVEETDKENGLDKTGQQLAVPGGQLGLLAPKSELISSEMTRTRIFGHDIFNSSSLSFEPNMNIATPSSYVLGPGDEVIIDVYGNSQTSQKLKITPEGQIIVPKIGPIGVSGLTVEQAQAKVYQLMGMHYQGSSIKVTVGQTRTVIVNVLGEVNTPGTYTLSAFSTVFNALYKAGGITDIGTLRSIKVSRNGRIISTIDVYDYIMNGNLTGNLMLRDNDVIIVSPYENLVEVTGKIKRPMFYEMKEGESLQSLLTFTGGFTGDAYRQKIRVERVGAEGQSVFSVNEWDFNSFSMQDGDVVTIEAAKDRYSNMVSVTGAVFHEGKYQLGGSINSVKTLTEHAGGLTEEAFTNRAVLHRLKADRTRRAMTIDIAGIMDGTIPDVILENEDSLVIGSREKQLTGKVVAINGEVHKAGTYQYSEGETLEDLIVEAGGLKDAASLLNVEIARNLMYLSPEEQNETEHLNSKIYHVTLKDGLTIEGESGFKLKPFDIVTIHVTPYYKEQMAVTILGEVKYTGSYVIGEKNERISSIINRAGGFTDMASIHDAVLERKLTDQERLRKEQLMEIANASRDTTDIKKLEFGDTYSVGIDLVKAVAHPGSSDDIVLRDGDIIRIPQYNNTVTINGEVLSPNVVNYVKGKGLRYYINQGGGFASSAHKSKTYIVYANGQVSRGSKGKVEPGCEIVVPTKAKKENASAQNTSLLISLAGVLATIGAVVISAIK